MKGVYVPFWIFDVDAEGSVAYNGERITKWRNGDTEYTKTEMYSMQRGGNLSFARVPADGSRKMDDTLMESIEPLNSVRRFLSRRLTLRDIWQIGTIWTWKNVWNVPGSE